MLIVTRLTDKMASTVGSGVMEMSTLDYCSNMIDVNLATHLPVIPAILIILLLSGLERRRFKGTYLDGRFGLVVPMGFLDGHRHRWSYTAASVAIASSLMRMFMRIFSIDVPVWAKGRSYITAMTLSSLPYAVALLFLFIQSLRKAVRCFLTKQFIQDEDSQRNTEDHNKTYLKVSLRKFTSLSSEDHGWKFWQYRSMPGFLFPTRILCIIAVVFAIIIPSVVMLHVILMPRLHSEIRQYEEITDCVKNPVICLSYRPYLYLLRVLAVSTYLAVIISLVVQVANILLFLRSFRRSLFKLFKGDKTFIITRQQTTQKYMAQSMRFMGYFIAYNLWGFIVVNAIVIMLCIFDGITVEYLSSKGKLGDLFVRVLEISVYPLTAIVLFYAQTFFVGRFLLQKKIHQSETHPPLAVDNRKFYNVFSYYMLFINVAVGVISCLARTASSFILALFQIGRLDKNLFLSGWHEKDRGYAAYVGMLQVEYTHNHPALRVFCSLLWDAVLEQRHRPVRVTSRDVYINMGDIGVNSPSVMTSSDARSHVYVNNTRNSGDSAQVFSKRRTVNRWQVAYTLVRNPSLICLRRHHPPRPEETRVPKEEHRPSLSLRCLGLAPIIVYKVSVASPLIIIGVMAGIPALTLIYFMS